MIILYIYIYFAYKQEKDGLKAIRNDSSAYDAQEKSSRSTSLRLLNKKAKKKGNSTLSVEEEQEREKVLGDFKIFTHYFIDKSPDDMKNVGLFLYKKKIILISQMSCFFFNFHLYYQHC